MKASHLFHPDEALPALAGTQSNSGVLYFFFGCALFLFWESEMNHCTFCFQQALLLCRQKTIAARGHHSNTRRIWMKCRLRSLICTRSSMCPGVNYNITKTMQALSHYSYHFSDGQRLVCDLQGGYYGDYYILTDPVIEVRGWGMLSCLHKRIGWQHGRGRTGYENLSCTGNPRKIFGFLVLFGFVVYFLDLV